MAEHEILTLEEVADYLRVSERTVYEWANKGEIPCGKLGTTWRFKRSEVERWVDTKLTRPAKPLRTDSVALRDVLSVERVRLLDCAKKDDALNILADALVTAPQVKDATALRREVFEREALRSTGIGFGIGVPHVRLPTVSDLVIAVGVNRRELPDYISLDERPVQIIFMVAARDNQHAHYLKTLAAISSLMKVAGVRESLLAAPDAAAVYDILTQGAWNSED
ncbi:MAG: PTS sugar transporter subunit IIA [Candidatus Hydrogenedentes bacterium]|nr:PTS sugar transporter subunit IIA [Candidatus Hydrogenedentota bacterium]